MTGCPQTYTSVVGRDILVTDKLNQGRRGARTLPFALLGARYLRGTGAGWPTSDRKHQIRINARARSRRTVIDFLCCGFGDETRSVLDLLCRYTAPLGPLRRQGQGGCCAPGDNIGCMRARSALCVLHSARLHARALMTRCRVVLVGTRWRERERECVVNSSSSISSVLCIAVPRWPWPRARQSRQCTQSTNTYSCSTVLPWAL